MVFYFKNLFKVPLDAFLHPAPESVSSGLIESGIKLPEKRFGIDW